MTILPKIIPLAEVAFLSYREQEEIELQARIIKARELVAGYFPEDLAGTTADFLPGMEAEDVEGINLPKIALSTVVRRLSFSQVTSVPPLAENSEISAETNPENETQPKLVGDQETDDFLRRFMEWNNIKVVQKELHKAMERDGEAFVLMDIKPEEVYPDDPTIVGKVAVYVHERYTDSTTTWKQFNGSGYGCKAHYRNDDPNQELEMISHRWVDRIYNEQEERFEAVQRMVLYVNEQGSKTVNPGEYLPARIEKYAMNDAGEWEEFQEETDEQWPVWWTVGGTDSGDSLPIPALHFRNEDIEPGHKQIWGLQAGLDQAFASLITGVVMTGQQMIKVFGFHPTTDGKPISTDSQGKPTNALQVGPRRIIGTANKGPRDADADVIPPGDITPILEGIDKIAVYVAFILGLPVANFMFSKSVASDETLRQGDTALISKINDLIALTDPVWRSVFRLARKIQNTYLSGSLDETIPIRIIWDIAERREPEYQALEAQAMRDASIPEREIQKRIWGIDDLTARRFLAENEQESERGIGPEVVAIVAQAKAQAAAAIKIQEATANTVSNGQQAETANQEGTE